MQKRREHKKWRLCESCSQMVYAGPTLGKHVCPASVQAKRDAELDMVIDEELSTWDQDVSKFWNDKRTQFNVWLVEKKRY